MDDYGQDRFLEHLELEEDKVGDRNLMGIYKKWSGLIFDDAFLSGEIHSRYQLSPTTACTLDTGLQQLIMSHTEPETMLLFDAPKDEPTLLLEVTADYVPIAYGDEGGIVIWQDGYHRLEFLESKDTTTREYSRWRAEKKGNRWIFYADRGLGWELFDSADLSAEKIGVLLKNPQRDEYEKLRLDRLVLCKSNKITMGNLPEGYSVFLCDSDGYAIASSKVEPTWTGAHLELPTMPFSGILRVYDENGVLLSSLGAMDMYGGDLYLYGTDLRVLWKDKELSLSGETYLGTMYDNTIQVQMELYNPSKNKKAEQISMGILKYLEEFGYEWADLSHDDGSDHPQGDYMQRLPMGTLPPDGKMKFWMRIERKNEHFGIKPLHFILDITHI